MVRQNTDARPSVMALVPARGGSKSIPRKNVKPLAGHPLIAYSIAAGLQATSVDRVLVSTDDEEIAEVGRRYGAEVPFLRPAELAQDDTPDLPVFTHLLKWLAENEGRIPDILVQLRPTTPIRPPEMVDRAVELLLGDDTIDSVRGVVPSSENPYKMWRISTQGRLEPLLTVAGVEEPFNSPRQSLPATFWQTGHIDAIRVSTILLKNSLSGSVIAPLMLDPAYAVDIDTDRDWEQAAVLVANRRLDVIRPGSNAPRKIPDSPTLVVFDFDGVMTDDRAWVDQDGRESVAVHRGDGLGISSLVRAGIPVMVLSTETNPVVAARCRKLGIECIQGQSDKAVALKDICSSRGIELDGVVYVGNDVNDLPCFPIAGYAVAVADAHEVVAAAADLVLSRPGGYGAVREFCDLLLGVRTSPAATDDTRALL